MTRGQTFRDRDTESVTRMDDPSSSYFHSHVPGDQVTTSRDSVDLMRRYDVMGPRTLVSVNRNGFRR